MVKVLVTGGSGRIGSRVVERLSEMFPPEDKVYLLKRKGEIKDIDPCFADRVCIVESVGNVYDFTFHLAANTHTRYNQDTEWIPRFREDNVDLTRRIVESSGRVLMVSTDNVFSGSEERDYSEDDEPNPNQRNTYGVTKAEAEKIVLDGGGDVIRIQSMLGVKNNLIVDRVIDAIEGRKYWPFWDDVYVRPSYFEDLLKVAKKVYASGKNRVYHVSANGEPLSRAGIAYKILDIYKNKGLPILIEELKTAPCDNPKFPRRLVLDSRKTQEELGLDFSSVSEALENHILYVKGVN